MKLISSKMTFFQKRVLPLLWFALVAFISFSMLRDMFRHKGPDLLTALFIPAALVVFGYLVMKKLIFGLMDEVWDAGDVIVVRNKDQKDNIALSDIMNVSYSNFSRTQRVTLTFRKPCHWGTKVTFMPPVSLIPFRKNPLIQDLVARIDAKRQG